MHAIHWLLSLMGSFVLFVMHVTFLWLTYTGSVAAGKSTLCGALRAALEPARRVEVVSTDGFLWPNAVLAGRGVLMRKGYPETYDRGGLAAALRGLREALVFPANPMQDQHR